MHSPATLLSTPIELINNTDIYSANYMTAVHVAKQTWP